MTSFTTDCPSDVIPRLQDIKAMGLDEKTLMLLQMIVLYKNDRNGLAEPDKVNSFQVSCVTFCNLSVSSCDPSVTSTCFFFWGGGGYIDVCQFIIQGQAGTRHARLCRPLAV